MGAARRVVTCLAVLVGLGCSGASSSVSDGNRPTTTAPAVLPVARPKPQGAAQPTLPIGTVELEVENRQLVTLRVEVASTPREQQQGLMFREHMADDAGMLFVFPAMRHQSFWMRNTLIPLDMFFIDAEWKVIGVAENAAPLTDDPRDVEGESQYVLEVNGGFAKAHGFGAGTRVRYTPPGGK